MASIPHAGEDGVLGTEEAEVIIEAIKGAGRRSIVALGPFPADGFFGSRQYCGAMMVLWLCTTIRGRHSVQDAFVWKWCELYSGITYCAHFAPTMGLRFGLQVRTGPMQASMIQAVLLAASVVEQHRQQS